MNLCLSPGEHHFPKFTYLGSTSDPKFTSSNCIDELCILTLVGLLNLLFRSNIPSKVLTPLSMKFPLQRFAWCSSSSIITHLKFSSFVRNYKIFGSSLNTLRLVMFSGTTGLKINSMEHWLLVGTSLTTKVANKSAAAFFSLGIETILNASKFIRRSQTSFWFDNFLDVVIDNGLYFKLI